MLNAEFMTDWYLEDRSRLQGQPKRAVADYVERNGILIPRRFDSFEEAKASGLPLILRSEHPQDYDGVSGLLESPVISNGTSNEYQGVKSVEEVKDILFSGRHGEGHSQSRSYCRFMGIDLAKFKKDTSFSIWQYIPGLSRAILADSAIDGRYHLLSFNLRDSARSYIIFDNGKVNTLFSWKIPTEEKEVQRLIEDYEKIRRLGRFDSNHCPIMEFQTAEGANYFLQYHRTRDFLPTTFILDREAVAEELAFDLVRGVTESKGLEVKMTVIDADWYDDKEETELPASEDSSIECRGSVRNRIMFGRRRFQPICSEDHNWTYNKLSAQHSARDALFKPMISGVLNMERFIGEEEYSGLIKKAKKLREPQFINFHVVSDGRRAFIRRT